MPTSSLGAGVSRFIGSRDKQFSAVVFQALKPPCDAELNLVSYVDLEARAEEVRSRVASGWLMDELNPRSDFHTDPIYSNQFYFGRQESGEFRNLSWAVVNGWTVPVAGTRTGAPPTSPNNLEYWNKVQLNPPPALAGGNRAEFVFLEVWQERIDVDPAISGVAPGKPQRGYVYRFGNVEAGFSNMPDELVDPDINYETTKRVQIQYRIRVVTDVSLATYPEGFDPTAVFAQGALSVPSAVSFQNMRGELGDPGLWRAGTGDPTTFGTADGYVYAIPICSAFRRNSSSFSDVGNLAGAFNRNSMATSRTDATAYTSPLVLPAGGLTDIATSFLLSSIQYTVLGKMSSFGEAYFRIDDEIIRVTGITTPNYTVTISRGEFGTTNRAHAAGAPLVLYTVRPDGLFADQVTATDILDMRHSVADKFDYGSILKTNFIELLKGGLRSTWKRYGATNAGPVIMYGDRITDGSVGGSLTKLDSPDGNRRTWSDSVVTQRFNVPVKTPTNSDSLNVDLAVTVEPNVISALWSGSAPSHGPTLRVVSGYTTWFNGDSITIGIASFRTGVSGADADQIRFVLPSEDPDAVLVRFDGMTTDPNGGAGAGSVPPANSPSATDPFFTGPGITGKRILKDGDGLTVSLDISGNLVITFDSGTLDSELQEFVDALQVTPPDPAFHDLLLMHVGFTVVYGAGRGLSHKPDWVHRAEWKGSPSNSSRTILRTGLTNKSPMVPTYVGDSPLVQTGNDRQYSRTSEVMFDPGSKTVHVAPYRNFEIPNLLARHGNNLNWYGLGPTYQGLMPVLDQSGLPMVPPRPPTDPLSLFFSGSVDPRYVEVPLEYLPKPGLHHVPVLAASNSIFSSGINFLLMSNEGVPANTAAFNVNLVSYPSTSGYYIVTPKVLEVYGTGSGPVSAFGQKVSIPKLRAAGGGPFRGIRFPPFYGPARITGVYVRSGSAVTPVNSPFDTTRAFVGGPGTDVNLLRDDFSGPTYLIDVDVNGDPTFVLNADVLDLSRVPGTTFDTSDFIVECTLFGFDRGFLQTNGRLVVVQNSSVTPTLIVVGPPFSAAAPPFTNYTYSTVGLIAPAPMSVGSANNELTLYYSRAPYQGDPFGSQSAFSDDPYRLGPLTVSEAQSIVANTLDPVDSLDLLNKRGFEILDAVSFVTSLGTGRLSGSGVIPLLNQVEAPGNPPDYAGTWVDLHRRFALNNVGYEDWATSKWPALQSSLLSRPPTKIGAMSDFYDGDAHPELSGCTVQLPLGALFRDKDFVGKTLHQTRSASDNAAVSLGTASFVPFEASSARGSDGYSTWEGIEFVCGRTSNASGVGSESIICVDGTSSTSSTTTFKTARGCATYSASGSWPGGVVSSKFPKCRPNSEVGSVLMCTAYLVRSQPESVGGNEVHAGSELQMIVVTQAVPSYYKDSEIVHSANGMNEGFTAVDRFRLLGKPLEKRRGGVDLGLVPSDKPLFVNKIHDNPLFYGSGDRSMMSNKQESYLATPGQTAFTLSRRPLDPTTVQMFLNGVKLQYGVDYTVSGVENRDVTYIPGASGVPVAVPLLLNDIVEFFFSVW